MPRQSLSSKVTTSIGTKLRLDPRIVASSRLLQMPQQEFEEAVEEELEDNPALERVDGDASQANDESALMSRLSKSQDREADDFETYAAKTGNPDETTDWTDMIPAPVSLRDHLVAQLLPMVPRNLQELARHVVDCVNDKGYLDMPIEEIALTGNAEYDDVVRVVRQLQACEPIGVGATSVQECLDLQLSEFDDRIGIVARAIVQRHWDELLQKRTDGIAKRYNLSDEELEEALGRITSLAPYPGEAFLRAASASKASNSVHPDIIYMRSEHGVEIVVKGYEPADFVVNEWYRKRFLEMKGRRNGVDHDEKRHVTEFVNRAVTFIKAVHYRNRTLRRLADVLLDEQPGFITTGRYEFLHPMSRIQLARKLDLHESTVSRATLHKFVQLANGDVVPFEVFFKPQLRVRKMIEEMLAFENPHSPMTDREIMERLQEQGINVARRTVNKYRDQIRHLASHRRRTA
jgi:RNA polymerase sigma-54 factor